jgi:hypothetical protein
MADIHTLANAIIRMEGSDDPNSVNQRMVRQFGRWNVGHLVWAGQRNAVPVYLAGRNWAGWPTREASYEGLLAQIRLDASRGLTLEQFIYKYAPSSENRSDVYLRNVSAWTGIDPKATLASAIAPGGSVPAPSPSPSSSPSQTQPVYMAWSGTWTNELAQTLNSALGTSLTPQQTLALTAGTAVLVLAVVIPPRRSPA